MKINKTELLACLNILKPGLAAKEVVEQSSSFVFMNNQAVTFNDEIAIHCGLPGDLEIDGAIPAKEFVSILTRFKGDEIDITQNDNELSLKCGKQRAGIKLEAEITLPINELAIPKKWIDLPDDFLKGLSACYPTASKDLTQPLLTNICLSGEHAVATDNSRIAVYSWENPSKFNDEILLPASTVPGLVRTNITKFHIESSGWCHFTNNDKSVVYSCRISEGKFPDVFQHLVFDIIGSIQFPNDMSETLDRAGVFLSNIIDTDNFVTIDINPKGVITIAGKGDVGWYEETCRTKWEGSDVVFSIYPQHLQEILKSTKQAQIGDGIIKFVSGQFQHVIALEWRESTNNKVPF